MNELKPCPFCGCKADFYKIALGNQTLFNVVACTSIRCDAIIGRDIDYTREEAIAAWNRRHVPEAES